jgi:hypothetical protein
MSDCVCIGIGITWLLCALAAGYTYSQKGRSYVAAFLLGILLGPIALILAVITPKDERALELRALRSGKMRKCPACAELVKGDANTCRYCGHEFDWVHRSSKSSR